VVQVVNINGARARKKGVIHQSESVGQHVGGTLGKALGAVAGTAVGVGVKVTETAVKLAMP